MGQFTSFTNALSAIDKYQRAVSLSESQLARVVDIKKRVQRLDHQFNRLMKLNYELMVADGVKSSFDSETGLLTFQAFGASMSIILQRADPNKPVQILSNAAFGAYDASHDPLHNNPAVGALRTQLEDETESFYAQAHRVQKKIQYLLQLKKTECKEIAIVRNRILEHPIDNVTNSFGYGTGGPHLSPMMRGKSEIQDNGLVHNAKAFDGFISEVFFSSTSKVRKLAGENLVR